MREIFELFFITFFLATLKLFKCEVETVFPSKTCPLTFA